MASQFMAWVKVEDKMPDIFDLLKNPDTTPVFDNRDADILHMLIVNLVEVADGKTLEPMIRYLKRLPNQEFVALWSQAALNRHPELNKNKLMTQFKLTDLTKVL